MIRFPGVFIWSNGLDNQSVVNSAARLQGLFFGRPSACSALASGGPVPAEDGV